MYLLNIVVTAIPYKSSETFVKRKQIFVNLLGMTKILSNKFQFVSQCLISTMRGYWAVK